MFKSSKKRKLTLLIIFAMAFLMFPGTAKADQDGNYVRIGIDYAQWYSGTGAPVSGNLESAYNASRADVTIINENPNWGLQFIWGNGDAWEKDFRSDGLGGNDYRLADDVDLMIWVGHGVTPFQQYGANDYSLIMNNQHDSYYAEQGDMYLGNRDLEWLVTFTCNFTSSSYSEMGRLMGGLHGLFGFMTDMTVTSNAGSRFSYWAATQAYPLSVAYENYGWDTQNASDANAIKIFRATQNWNDHLWGFGSVGSDPPSYASSPSSYEDYFAPLW